MIGLVSDTHGLLRPEVLTALQGVDRILHMGDVGEPTILDRLAEVAPVDAIRGNVDHGPWAEALPWTLDLEVFGERVYLLHDVGQLDLDPVAAGFRAVFYGHSHKPDAERRHGVLFANPGSCGPRRFTLPVSIALLDREFEIEFVDLT